MDFFTTISVTRRETHARLIGHKETMKKENIGKQITWADVLDKIMDNKVADANCAELEKEAARLGICVDELIALMLTDFKKKGGKKNE